MRRLPLAAAAVVAGFAVGPAHAAERVAETTAAGGRTELPSPDILDLFGNRAGAAAESRPAAEQDREIRRSERPARAAAGSEQTLVRRRSLEARGWQLWDAVPLLIVLGVILLAALLVKKFMPSRRLWGGGNVLQIVARTPLSGKQHLVLLKLGRRLVLLGVTPERISTLSIVEDPEQVALLIGEIASSHPHSLVSEFEKTFAGEAGAYVEPEPESPDQAASGQVRGLLEKVRRLAGGRDVA